MKKWALVFNGAVRQIEDADPSGRFHPSMNFVEFDEATLSVGQGWSWSAETGFSPPTPTTDISMGTSNQAKPGQAYRALMATGADSNSLFSRVNALAKAGSTSLAVEMAKLIGNLTEGGDWDAMMIGGTNACLANIKSDLATAGQPLTQVDVDWVNGWVNNHNLGLTPLAI